MTEGERAELQMYLALNPDQGALMPGTGGVRKLRWAGNGRGKSGGLRVIYYYHDNQMPIFLLALYSKGEKFELSSDEKNGLKALVRKLVEEYKGKRTFRLIS